jgi:hypothetical protein
MEIPVPEHVRNLFPAFGVALLNTQGPVAKGHIMIDYFWLAIVMLGPVLLGGAIFYSIMRQRRLSSRERHNSDAATHELYQKDENADTRPFGGRQ